MEYLNLIPIALVIWAFYRAIQGSLVKDPTDVYFKVNKGKTGVKFCNWFGVPRA